MEKLEGCCVPHMSCQLPPPVVHVHHVPSYFIFFFNLMAKEKQPFFLGMGDLKRDISFHVQFLSLSLYIYDTHTHTYIFVFFLLAGVSSRLHVLAVLSLITSVLLPPVLLSY